MKIILTETQLKKLLESEDDYFITHRPGEKYDETSRQLHDVEYIINLIQSARNKPNKIVKIYRAVPNDDNITTINDGDWVTLSKKYAIQHGISNVSGGDYKILTKNVKASDLYTNGDSIMEWGYSTD